MSPVNTLVTDEGKNPESRSTICSPGFYSASAWASAPSMTALSVMTVITLSRTEAKPPSTAAENTVLAALSLLLGAVCGMPVHRVLSKGYTYLELNEARYAPTVGGLVFALCASLICFAGTAILTALYIRVHSPIRLIRQDEA